jgi:amino acid adenylation domain-containing protein
MKNIAAYLYYLNEEGFFLWLENSKLKFRQYKENFNKNEILEKIKENKDRIIKFLEFNKCNSYESILSPHIYKSDNSQEILSFAQERLWFVEKYEEGTNAYNIPLIFKIGNAKLDLLEDSIKSIVERHEIFRTIIKQDEEGNGYQQIMDAKEFPLEISKLNVTDKAQLDLELQKIINRPYYLDKEYPIRVCLYTLYNKDLAECAVEHYLGVVIHHIAFDGWSIDILLKELNIYYQYYLEKSLGIKSKLDLPELPVQYKDFALWQRHYLSKDKLGIQLNYWQDKLNEYETLNLPTDKPRANRIDYHGKDIYFKIDEYTSLALRELAKELKVSLYSLLLAAYYLMLRCYSNQDDIVIGTPVANRHYSQIENSIGFFVNSLVLRTKINLNSTVKEYLQKIGSEVLEAQLYQDIPFEKVVEKLKVAKDASRHPIFQVLFGVQSFGSTLSREINLEVTKNTNNLLQRYTTDSDLYSIARFDISTFIDDSDVCLSGSFNYVISLYTEETINRFIGTYIKILEEFSKLHTSNKMHQEIKLFELNYLNNTQYRQLIDIWNQTDYAYPKDKTIHELFEEQVKRTPDNIAIICDNQRFTYREINTRSDILADHLVSLGAGPEVLVGIGIYRQVELIIGLLGILKAGAAYVPLDPEYPEEYLKHVILDSNLQILVVTAESKDKFHYYNKQFVYAEKTKYFSEKIREKAIFPSPDNLAYIIYTSGSTGKPKGVANHHRGVINRLQWAWDNYPFSNDEVCCLQSSICFVDSTWDIFGTLLIGFPLVLYKAALGKNVDSFLQQCFSSKITRITLLPSFLEELITLAQTDVKIYNNFKQIKHLEVTGELFKADIFLKFIQTFGNKVTFLDCYGATEATSVVYKDFNQDSKGLTRIISNTKIYVLSNYLTPVPMGSIGELYIGGVGLARGYLNRPELTAERFIANPFLSETESEKNINARLYKTGDLVRRLPDGNIEFIGRNDFQVKLRGYRIELGEIENVLLDYEGIKQTVVIAKDLKDVDTETTLNRYLIGYYVSNSKLDEDAILNYLQARLPVHMVPTFLVHLGKLPLTSNGKLDRKNLPAPEMTNADKYVAPRNKLESRMCQIWEEVLGMPKDKIGVNDDFFRLGGNSILAIKLASKINKELSVSASISSIFKQSTISKLVAQLDDPNEDKMVIRKTVINRPNERILSFAQERLWFIERYEEGTNAYNMPNVFKLSKDVNIYVLENSIRSIVDRHEVLHSLIKEDDNGSCYQEVLDLLKNPLKVIKEVVESKAELNQKIDESVNKLFDLTHEYPIKVYLYKYITSDAPGGFEYYLSIVIHHIAFDGWSYVVFFKELQAYYDYYLKQSLGLTPDLNLPTLDIQYVDFAIWQRKYLSGEKINKQINFWKDKLNGYETLRLPTDKIRPGKVAYEGRDIYFELDEETSTSLRKLAKELKVSLYSLLLAGYYVMLRCYSNQNDLVVGTPIANRHYSQIENLIGFFVNALALRVKIESKTLIKDFIQMVGKEIVEAQLHQDLPFEKLVDELNLVKDTSRHPIFQVVFGVQGFGGEVYNKVYDKNVNNIANLLQPHTTGSNLYNIAKFDISTFIDDSETCLRGNFNYATSLYTELTITGFIETYTRILKQFADLKANVSAQAQTKISDIKYLNEDQYNQIVNTWNKTKKTYPSNKTIHTLFEEQVEKTPNSIAIVYNGIRLSYRELNEKSNKLANYLKSIYDIKPDTLVALYLDRSEYILIAILAVLKAGGAYVPMDPSYPSARIKFILQDTHTKILLTDETHYEKLNTLYKDDVSGMDSMKTTSLNIISINCDSFQQKLTQQPVANPYNNTIAANIAYVIYTSGTTGNPKGVLQFHGNVFRLFTATQDWYQFNSKDVWTLFHSYVFDFSVWEIWGAFIYGGTLVIPTYEQVRDPEIFYLLCKQEQVTVLNQTPTAFYQFINLAITRESDKLTHLRYVIFGGEALNLTQLVPWFNYYGYNQPTLINMYGITETTVHVTYKQISEKDLGDSSYIGELIPDLKSYVLNDNLVPLPVGAIGELYVGGMGLARGYLNRPELTAEKFIPNPFVTNDENDKNIRLYKTGDLVRRLSKDNMIYIGRNDFQIKIRGYRIELGEIEAVISGYELIKQSIVIAKEHADSSLKGNKYLIAYYIKEINLQSADTEHFVDTWETAYQLQYSTLDVNHFKQNFKGWNSSYTDLAIDKEDMIEWVNKTIERVKQLNPQVILEIGSGSGLILFNIIDNCNHYYATDFSKNAIDHINKVVDYFKFTNKVSTLSCRADELPYRTLDIPYDTVVLNSVIQYFPNLDYLETIIVNAIINMKNSGKIFIGDIRDYRLLKCFHFSVQKYKHQKVTKADVEYFSKRDKELLIAPEYFVYLQRTNKYISSIEIMPKFGKANHEMNNYRYDVILHINKSEDVYNTTQNDIQVNDSNFIKVLNIEEWLSSKPLNDYACVKYPNKRIINDYIEYHQLYSNAKEMNIESYVNLLDINEISEKAEVQNYKVKFLLDINDPLYFNIILFKDNPKAERNIYFNYLPTNRLQRSDLANNPLVSSKLLTNQFSSKLREYLNSKLPEYMVPEHYIQLEKLPLTINGKLDLSALPDPEFTSSDMYVAPRNELETKLCEIWGEVLGLDQTKIGIKDDFFRLGGNSILAIKLSSKINNYYQSHLKVSDIFVYKNIELLLLRMLQTKDTYQTVVKLNNTDKMPNMFMIHPGIGGCEVYISLANKLNKSYSCYGIDSYNLYHFNKIDNMNELAKYYLSYIDKIMVETQQSTYHLLGWSIGGQIAMEMAYVLEQRGITNIKIYLLDAVIYDENLYPALDIDVEKTKSQFMEEAASQGYDPVYIEKSISNIDIETKLVKQKIPTRLTNTKALFFKAMLGDTKYKQDEYHNIDKFFIRKSDIKLIKVEDAHHGNILDLEELLISEIASFNANKRVVSDSVLEVV